MSKTVLEMNSTQARDFFLRQESYTRLSWPEFYDFKTILHNIAPLNLNPLNNTKAKQYEGVNCNLYSNKDGRLSWRNIQLLHPVLYKTLVELIVKEENWKIIRQRLIFLSKNKKIKCVSLPHDKKKYKRQKAANIRTWIEHLEQETFKMSLSYKYMFITDVTNCYSSIYTHSIGWALHDKDVIKDNLLSTPRISYLGEEIDKLIRIMQHNQTNGIPEGSVLMDLVAEIVLAYGDYLIGDKLKENRITDYRIIRYRDDYRVFSSKKEEIEKIGKIISEVLLSLNLKLNDKKTLITDDIVGYALKKDKVKRIVLEKIFKDKIDVNMHQKFLIQVYEFSKENPNSGGIVTILYNYYNHLKKSKNPRDIEVTIAILLEIILNNPNCIEIGSAIISKLLSKFRSNKKAVQTGERILKKFKDIPYLEIMNIWIHRMLFKVIPEESLKVNGKLLKTCDQIWNCAWMDSKDPNYIFLKNSYIVDFNKMKTIDKVITNEEVDTFITSRNYK